MLIVIYAFLLPMCSLILCVFSFFVGRCARKLPIIDDGLPWAISRSQIPRPLDAADPARSPEQMSGYSGVEIAHIYEAAGWTSPGKTGKQTSPLSPESRTDGRAA